MGGCGVTGSVVGGGLVGRRWVGVCLIDKESVAISSIKSFRFPHETRGKQILNIL